jgi:hypothetical protein
LPFCPYCGKEIREDYSFCRSCGRRIDGTLGDKEQIVRLEEVNQPNVWLPILWLVVLLASSFLLGWLGVIVLILATVWVYKDSKNRKLGDSLWILTLLFAIVGLPLYAYRLHQLRKGHVFAPTSWGGVKTCALVILAIWIGSWAGIGVSYALLYTGATGIAEFVAMVSTGTLVLTTIVLLPLGAILLIRLLRRQKTVK